MHVALQQIMLTGLGVHVDVLKLRAGGLTGEDIKLNIQSAVRFPEADKVESTVVVESESASDAVRFRCTYVGLFSIAYDKAVKEEDQKEISAICTAKIFPYVRELVADITRRLPLSAPISLDPSLGDEKTLLAQMNMSVSGPEGKPN